MKTFLQKNLDIRKNIWGISLEDYLKSQKATTGVEYQVETDRWNFWVRMAREDKRIK